MLRRHARTVRILLAGVLLAVFFLGAGNSVQVSVLPEVADTGKFLANHKDRLQGFGIDPWQGGAFGDGTNEPVLYRFQDADAEMPARRCVNRALRVLDRIVFAVTLVSVATGEGVEPPT
jgi:hypothetical protein